MNYHQPVLLHECLEGLRIIENGVYVDVTFGGGGHSQAILSQLGNHGTLVAFDQDPDARVTSPSDKRFTLVPANFRYLKNYLKLLGIKQIDGLLADLGVSSHQLDTAERGFSIRYDGPLDMRMNPAQSLNAEKVLNQYGESELKTLFKHYGEVNNAGRLAARIVEARKEKPLKRTQQLMQLLKGLSRPDEAMSYAAQVFQAVRIEVNQELDNLYQLLEQANEVLKPGGRLVVLSYHSLEDRLVKHWLRSGNADGVVPKDFFGRDLSPFKLITRKAIRPADDEVQKNPRSRSALLRIAEKK